MRIIAIPVWLAALAVLACGDPDAARIAQYGCGAVDGADALSGRDAAKFVLVGEFTETAEAPAAFAELACHIAARDGALFVGVINYFGGTTDAEIAMRARLAELAAKGAPITVGVIGEAGREIDRRERSRSEQRWAEAIMAKVEAAGAERALLLVARSDAALAPAAALGERFVGYDPMPLHLPAGQVVSLEIAKSQTAKAEGAATPLVRLFDVAHVGFHGELVFAELTRPSLPALYFDPASEAGSRDSNVSAGADPNNPDNAVDDGEESANVRALRSILLDLEMIEAAIRSSPAPSDYTDIEFDALREALREEIVKTRRQLRDAEAAATPN